MTNSTRRQRVRKPAEDKPDWRKQRGLPPDFPLFIHWANEQKGVGRWGKKVRRKVHYFGNVANDPKGEGALALWLEQKDDLIAGRKPRSKDGLTVYELCTKFLHSKQKLADAGEITQRTFRDHKDTCKRIVAKFGENRLVDDLRAEDFEELRASVAKDGGPHHVGNTVQRVRVVFKYAYDAGLILAPVRYGPAFKKPSKKVLRLARAEKGPKMLEAADVLKLLNAADVQMQAMIYLAVNAGMGNSDVGNLPLAVLDLDGGWLDYPRVKTGIDRRIPLWPETVAALREAIAKRPKPKTPEAEPLVFVTKYGAPWAKATVDNPVTKEFRKLLDVTKLHRPGLGFYTLRHVFRTIADGSRDQPAINSIMGHADPSMAAIYRERIEDARLRAVADHVREWLQAAVQKAKIAAQTRPAS